MATLQAASGTAAAAAIAETIVGFHVWKIDGFSGTKDLGVGKSIRSSTFNVGGHVWYIECYPCGVSEKWVGWVTLFLCLSDHKEHVEAESFFTLMGIHGDIALESGCMQLQTYNAETLWGSRGAEGFRMEMAEVESLLEGDCFQVRCEVSIVREFPPVPPPELHRPLTLSDLVASGMRREPFTLHRGLRGPSTHVAASSTTSAACSSAVARISAENVAGSHVLTIYGYSNAKKALPPGEFLNSTDFNVGEDEWYIQLYPCGEKDEVTDCLAIFLVRDYSGEEAVTKVRFELTLLTLAREVISSTQSCYAFTGGKYVCRCYLPFNMEPELSPLGDSFHVKCDITIVNEITPLRPPNLHLHLGDLLANQVGTDVEFEVGGDLFSAHKCVLATRSTAFMAEFFGPAAGKGSNATVTRVQIDDMEPRVFKALLHFIYTDALPEVYEDDDKVVMAKGLLVAADRYAMERLKLICGDMLCSYIKDARMAITSLDLADKHGCHSLREACKKFLMDHFAKVTP